MHALYLLPLYTAFCADAFLLVYSLKLKQKQKIRKSKAKPELAKLKLNEEHYGLDEEFLLVLEDLFVSFSSFCSLVCADCLNAEQMKSLYTGQVMLRICGSIYRGLVLQVTSVHNATSVQLKV